MSLPKPAPSYQYISDPENDEPVPPDTAMAGCYRDVLQLDHRAGKAVGRLEDRAQSVSHSIRITFKEQS
jgi:hypothetical protein